MPTVDQLGSNQALLASNPLAYVASFFALYSLVISALYIRLRDRFDKERSTLHAERMEMADEQTAIIVSMLKAPPAPRRRRREPPPEAPRGDESKE